MSILAWIICGLSLLCASGCVGFILGYGISQTNPSHEVPIRTVRGRGDVVDLKI